MRKLLAFGAILGVVLLFGCRTSTPVTSYVLAPETCKVELSGNAVSLRGLILPDYLDSMDFVYRKGPHQIAVLKYHQWAQDYRKMVRKSLEYHFLSGSAPGVKPLEVSIELERFEMDENKVFHVAACCKVLDFQNGVHRTRIVFEDVWKGKDVEELVCIHDRSLARLAREILARAGK